MAFIATAIVASQPSHQFLVLSAAIVVEELGSFAAAQCCCGASVMGDYDIAVLAAYPLESLWCGHVAVSHMLVPPRPGIKARKEF